MDMTPTVKPNSHQLNADDLLSGPVTIKITGVSANPESDQQPVKVSFDGDDGKPYLPCKSMRRVMIAVWGPDASEYVGKSMTLYCDPTVKFGGMAVGGIRISHMSGMDKAVTLALTASKAKRAPYQIKPLSSGPSVDPDAAKVDARAHAAQGRDAFNAWWKANPDKRDAIQPIMDELKSAVAKADAPDGPDIEDDETPM